MSLSQVEVTQNPSSSVVPPVVEHSINVPPVAAPRRGWLSNINIYPEDIFDCCKCVILGGGTSLIVGGFYSLPTLLAGISNTSRNLKYASFIANNFFLGYWGCYLCRRNINLLSRLTWAGSVALMFGAVIFADAYLEGAEDEARLINIALTVPGAVLGSIGDIAHAIQKRNEPNIEEN